MSLMMKRLFKRSKGLRLFFVTFSVHLITNPFFYRNYIFASDGLMGILYCCLSWSLSTFRTKQPCKSVLQSLLSVTINFARGEGGIAKLEGISLGVIC